MKDSKALHHLHEICDTYEKQAAQLKSLRGQVRELTRQRDTATARNAELRAQLADSKRKIAELAQEKPMRQSVWPTARVYRSGVAA